MVSKHEREEIIGPSRKHSLNQRKLKAGREGKRRAFGDRDKIVEEGLRKERIQRKLQEDEQLPKDGSEFDDPALKDVIVLPEANNLKLQGNSSKICP